MSMLAIQPQGTASVFRRSGLVVPWGYILAFRVSLPTLFGGERHRTEAA